MTCCTKPWFPLRYSSNTNMDWREANCKFKSSLADRRWTMGSCGPPVRHLDVMTSPESLLGESRTPQRRDTWRCTLCAACCRPSSPHPVKPLTTAIPAEEKRTEGRSVLEKLKSTIHPGRVSQLTEQETERKKVHRVIISIKGKTLPFRGKQQELCVLRCNAHDLCLEYIYIYI